MYNISIEKIYSTKINIIINSFRDNSVFKLTGANEIYSDFKTGGKFCLTFTNRGIIQGIFTKITEDEIVLEWNVDGFQRPSETETIVEILFKQDNERCILNLNHKNIPLRESADTKKRAWTEILNELENQINK